MTGEPRHRRFGDLMSDYIVQVANELPLDAVDIWQIVPAGDLISVSKVMH